MFDLVAGATEHIPRRPAVPVLISLAAQLGLVATVGVASVVIGAGRLPEMPTMMAFVADLPPAPPPPPPPAPVARPAERAAARPETPATALPAPAAAPDRIELEPATGEEADEGVPGGVEGGIPGGQVGGALADLPAPPPPPPPAPTAPTAPAAPIRVGGKVPQPALLQRVEPEYPSAAIEARVQGIVILETVVGEDGRVIEVRVLRSAGDVLDRAAIAAIRQWRYAPLELNGVRARFLLTATLSFKLD